MSVTCSKQFPNKLHGDGSYLWWLITNGLCLSPTMNTVTNLFHVLYLN